MENQTTQFGVPPYNQPETEQQPTVNQVSKPQPIQQPPAPTTSYSAPTSYNSTPKNSSPMMVSGLIGLLVSVGLTVLLISTDIFLANRGWLYILTALLTGAVLVLLTLPSFKREDYPNLKGLISLVLNLIVIVTAIASAGIYYYFKYKVNNINP